MHYRKFGKTGIEISALGFGGMRLPADENEAIRVIRHALDLGVNYVDTAVVYGESETIIGKAIKGYRDRIYLSTKNPTGDTDGKAWRERLEKSLRKMDVDNIDFYQIVHGMSWKGYQEKFSVPGAAMEEAYKAKEEGLIGHLCYSSHDKPEGIIKLIDTGRFEGMTVQYNLLDRGNEPAIEHAARSGMGVVIMGPVGGGRLAAPSETVMRMIPGEVKSSAEVALRFVLANPNVTCAISGMNTIAQVEENVATASREEPLSDAERVMIGDALAETKKLADLYCTGCRYCMPCPNEVNIAENFLYMNYHRVWGLTEHAKRMYQRIGSERWHVKGKKASECMECGECEPKCPQNISISEQLKETAKTLGDEG